LKFLLFALKMYRSDPDLPRLQLFLPLDKRCPGPQVETSMYPIVQV